MEKSIVIVGRNLLPGGAERVIVQLANYFVAQNIKTTIITMDIYDVFFEVDKRVTIHKIAQENKSSKLRDKIYRYGLLRKKIQEIRPTIVLSLPEDVGIYVILALLGTKIPVIVSERNNPWVMPDVKITRFLRRIAYPFAKGIVFQTEMAKSFFSTGIQKKGIVINNPVDLERIPEKYEGERRKVIVSVGRLASQKNFRLLINAFNEFSENFDDYSLVIYGEGDLRSELEQQIAILGLENKVSLPGATTDVLDRIKDCAMFILSSNYEGMPNVLIEAMCMGMPVISTDCPSGGPRELIKDNFNGCLVPVGNKDKILNAMGKLTDNNFSKKISNNAYKLRAVLSDKKVFEKWESFLFSK